jgi:hypothetical protein
MEQQRRERLQPAASIIDRLGGEAKVAEITDTASTAPYRWQYSREKGGTGGLIPQRYHRRLLDYAKDNGIRLRAADFLEPETEAA